MESTNIRDSVFSRRPKGTGSVYKLSGQRSKPWVAALTTGRNKDTGKQIQTPQGYFKTKEEAIDCLTLVMLKNQNILPSEIVGVQNLEEKYVQFIYNCMQQNILPSDVREIKDTSLINSMFMVKIAQEGINIQHEVTIEKSKSVPTLAEIWEIVFERELSELSKSARQGYSIAFRKELKSLHDKKINTITYNDIQPIFDEMMARKCCHGKMNETKITLNYIFKYALKYDWVEKNYAEYVVFKDKRETRKFKSAIDKETLNKLHKLATEDKNIFAMAVLIMCWTGMRPSELLEIKKENVHLEEDYMIGGKKTKNGINRTIPIHTCIKPFVEHLFNTSKGTYMFTENGVTPSYNSFNRRWVVIKNHNNIDNEITLHYGRHTFATLCEEHGLNAYLVKVIMGHSSNDLTKDVYTHASADRLVAEVNKLTPISQYIC